MLQLRDMERWGDSALQESDELYAMWKELLQIADPKAFDAQLRKIGNYKFEQFEAIPLFNVFIEVVIDPKIVADWLFSG